MKLFEPEAAEHFVFATIPVNAKPGAVAEYKAIRAGDMESALNQMDGRVRPAAPYCMGRYDHLCLLYTSPSPRDQRGSRMPSSA